MLFEVINNRLDQFHEQRVAGLKQIAIEVPRRRPLTAWSTMVGIDGISPLLGMILPFLLVSFRSSFAHFFLKRGIADATAHIIAGLGLAAWPLAARAQQPERMRRITVWALRCRKGSSRLPTN
jgi:hypothetical protein